jgi:dihydrofolate reductase
MPTAIFHTTISLDGFTAGPGGSMDWMFVEGDHGPAAEEVIDRVGAILAGRRSWDPNPALAADERTAKPYGGRWSGPIVVLTHRPEEEPDDPDVTFVSGDVEAALDLALEKAGGKDVVLFGASLTAQCLRAGLVGELVVHIIPVLLGRGTPLFPVAAGDSSLPLELVESYSSGQITTRRLRPRS